MEATATFYDIIVPAAPMVASPPPSLPIVAIALAVTVLVFLAAALLRRWWLLRGLQRLTRQWRANYYDDREIVYLLAAELRAKLELRRISAEPPAGLRTDAQARWAVFVRQLDRARYQVSGTHGEGISWLLAEARYWLLHTKRIFGKVNAKC